MIGLTDRLTCLGLFGLFWWLELQREAKRKEYVEKQKQKLQKYQEKIKTETDKIQELINLGIDPKSLNI